MNKILYLIFTFLVYQPTGFGQRFFSVLFTQLPKDNQLYARDDNDRATIPISGIIELAGWSHFSAIVYRNSVRVDYRRVDIKYPRASVGSFEMSVNIKAELADYSIEVYAYPNKSDSVKIVGRNNIVAGDFYVIQGQSNAAAVINYPNYSNKYCRTIGRIPDNVPTFKAADTLWREQEWVTPAVGYWGRELSKLIAEQHNIPVCIINGAIPGTTIEQHAGRNDDNPSDFNSIYGHLVYRVKISGATRIRAFIFYQGEEDALRQLSGYTVKFDKLYKNWQIDFPMVDKFIVFQINILNVPFYEAGAIRNFQRTAKTIYPKTDNFGTIGLPAPPDNVHYTAEGYILLAERLFKYLGSQFYGVKTNAPFRNPGLQKVFYTNTQKNAIKLVFDEGQSLVWGNDTTFSNFPNQSVTVQLKNQFFLDGNESKPASIKSWTIDNHQLIINLNEASTAAKINYLPSFSKNSYVGPYLKNRLGWGAFSFHEVSIKNSLEIQDLKISSASFDKIVLQWKPVTGAATLLIKRKKAGENSTVMKELKGDATTFEDISLATSTDYTYQIQAFSPESESPIYEASTRTGSVVLSTTPITLSWQIYPTLVQNELTIEFIKPTTGEVRLIDLIGNVHKVHEIRHQSLYRLLLTTYPAGTYFIVFNDLAGSKLSQRIVKY
ncbi:sialate O-acetylesterase [Runella slithyformis]|uniref:Fibronectin type-III domain-containing protein n=1 Tax=Runella slithyformis (strain ATCC 29530 / DSM 19594 / LMG 11500 / NCIMB 11436 / LSU 4) TaxID=761193 RepID=A0A7U3ZR70_RUNSL|nr:sialate O-acetylesterase [Runella slithyformis]AEI51867.1 protein of unknown function DUF303 acetylesterase [Runella slithyformis DSM 19594]